MTSRYDIQEFLNLHISPDIYTLNINNFSIDTMEDKFGSVEDKFIVGIWFAAAENKLASFTKNITNIYCLDSYNGDYHFCGIVATKEELVQLFPKLSVYDLGSYNIHYYTVSHKTFTKATRYLSDTLHLDTKKIYLRYDDLEVVIDDSLDKNSFYVIINCYGNYSQEDILTTYKTLENLLSPYCDGFTCSRYHEKYNCLLLKNTDSKFMSKFNLVKGQLDTEINGLLVNDGYLKTFEN